MNSSAYFNGRPLGQTFADGGITKWINHAWGSFPQKRIAAGLRISGMVDAGIWRAYTRFVSDSWSAADWKSFLPKRLSCEESFAESLILKRRLRRLTNHDRLPPSKCSKILFQNPYTQKSIHLKVWENHQTIIKLCVCVFELFLKTMLSC